LLISWTSACPYTTIAEYQGKEPQGLGDFMVFLIFLSSEELKGLNGSPFAVSLTDLSWRRKIRTIIEYTVQLLRFHNAIEVNVPRG